MRKAFLKTPIEFGRMSSAYNKRRFHPVLKKVKAHLGTDYAAPKGTPIRAVGSGVVTRASTSQTMATMLRFVTTELTKLNTYI